MHEGQEKTRCEQSEKLWSHAKERVKKAMGLDEEENTFVRNGNLWTWPKVDLLGM